MIEMRDFFTGREENVIVPVSVSININPFLWASDS